MTRRDAILAAARSLFAEQGYDGTATAQIAERAGVAHGTVFHHFQTKENLLFEMGEALTAEYVEGLSELPLAEGSGWDALECALRYHFAFMQRHSRGIVVLVRESRRALTSAAAGAHAERIRQGMAEVRALRRQILERGQADGSVRTCALGPALFLLESLLNGIVNLQAKGWAEPPEGLEEEAIAFCRRSLAVGG